MSSGTLEVPPKPKKEPKPDKPEKREGDSIVEKEVFGEKVAIDKKQAAAQLSKLHREATSTESSPEQQLAAAYELGKEMMRLKDIGINLAKAEGKASIQRAMEGQRKQMLESGDSPAKIAVYLGRMKVLGLLKSPSQEEMAYLRAAVLQRQPPEQKNYTQLLVAAKELKVFSGSNFKQGNLGEDIVDRLKDEVRAAAQRRRGETSENNKAYERVALRLARIKSLGMEFDEEINEEFVEREIFHKVDDEVGKVMQEGFDERLGGHIKNKNWGRFAKLQRYVDCARGTSKPLPDALKKDLRDHVGTIEADKRTAYLADVRVLSRMAERGVDREDMVATSLDDIGNVNAAAEEPVVSAEGEEKGSEFDGLPEAEEKVTEDEPKLEQFLNAGRISPEKEEHFKRHLEKEQRIKELEAQGVQEGAYISESREFSNERTFKILEVHVRNGGSYGILHENGFLIVSHDKDLEDLGWRVVTQEEINNGGSTSEEEIAGEEFYEPEAINTGDVEAVLREAGKEGEANTEAKIERLQTVKPWSVDGLARAGRRFLDKVKGAFSEKARLESGRREALEAAGIFRDTVLVNDRGDRRYAGEVVCVEDGRCYMVDDRPGMNEQEGSVDIDSLPPVEVGENGELQGWQVFEGGIDKEFKEAADSEQLNSEEYKQLEKRLQEKGIYEGARLRGPGGDVYVVHSLSLLAEEDGTYIVSVLPEEYVQIGEVDEDEPYFVNEKDFPTLRVDADGNFVGDEWKVLNSSGENSNFDEIGSDKVVTEARLRQEARDIAQELGWEEDSLFVDSEGRHWELYRGTEGPRLDIDNKPIFYVERDDASGAERVYFDRDGFKDGWRIVSKKAEAGGDELPEMSPEEAAEAQEMLDEPVNPEIAAEFEEQGGKSAVEVEVDDGPTLAERLKEDKYLVEAFQALGVGEYGHVFSPGGKRLTIDRVVASADPEVDDIIQFTDTTGVIVQYKLDDVIEDDEASGSVRFRDGWRPENTV